MSRGQRALAAIVAAAVLAGCAWALVMPPAEVPDEPLHVAYVQSLVERGEPADVGGDADDNVYSTEQRLARERSNYEAPIHNPSVKPEWRASEFARWRAEQRRLDNDDRADGGELNAAAGNPPLYYAWEAVAYRATASADLFTRWYAMRVWSVLLLAAAVVAAWLLAGELTRRDRLGQLCAAGFVGLQPGATAISGGINPDGAMIALWALVMWLGVHVLRRGPSAAGIAALLGATLAALLTKATSFGLLPAVVFVLAVSARRALRGRRLRGRLLVAAVVGLVAAAAVVVLSDAPDRLERAVSGKGSVSPLGFVSYLWQAYLPNLPFQEPLPGLAAFWGYDVWIRSGWGNFGWSELLLPSGVYAAIAAGCGLIALGALAALARRRFVVDRPSAVFLALVAGVLVLGLHWAEYRQFLDIQLSLLQGRYLLPLLPIGGLAAAAALANLRERRRPAAAGLLLVALFALQVLSLGIAVGRFYA